MGRERFRECRNIGGYEFSGEGSYGLVSEQGIGEILEAGEKLGSRARRFVRREESQHFHGLIFIGEQLTAIIQNHALNCGESLGVFQIGIDMLAKTADMTSNLKQSELERCNAPTFLRSLESDPIV